MRHFRIFRLPHFQEQGQRHQADEGRGDVRQLRADVIGRVVLGDGKAQARHQRGRPYLTHAAQTIHHEHQPERHQQRQQRQLAARHGADQERVDARHLARHDDGDAHGAEGHGCRVGDQAQARRVQRVEAQAHQQCRGDGHGRAETGRPFQEGAEGKADQQHLQALVVRDRQHGGADDVDLPRLDDNFIQEDGRDDDPGDRPQAIGEAIAGRRQRLRHGHAIGENRHGQRQRQGDGGRHVALDAQRRQGDEEEDDGNGCRQ